MISEVYREVPRQTFSTPRQLYEKVEDGPQEDAENDAQKEEIGALLNFSDSVWKRLKEGKFDEKLGEYVTFNVYGRLSTPYDKDDFDGIVDEIEVCLTVTHDDKEEKRTLGGIKRIGTSNVGVAYVYLSLEKTETKPLCPQDEAWDAIVGTLGRTIGALQQSLNVCRVNSQPKKRKLEFRTRRIA